MKILLTGKLTAVAVLLILISSAGGRETSYKIYASIEAVRKGNLVTLAFTEKPAVSKYYIIDGVKAQGEVSLLSSEKTDTGYRVLAVYRVYSGPEAKVVQAGRRIALSETPALYRRDFSSPYVTEKPEYREKIISPIDKREMILIPEGKFVFGSNSGARDEFPQSERFAGFFYIDRYEVSNSDYMNFVRSARAPLPRSWAKDGYPDDKASCPVMVTLHEAEAYARWAGKRLPSEIEWEKAARGFSGNLYPWGNEFEPGRANSMELWADEKGLADLQKKYGSAEPSLLPVDSFVPEGDSPFGVANMAGNAPEWTSDWYRAYDGNTQKNEKFGNRYRVVRGGGWFHWKDMLRSVDRNPSGIPNLYRDNSAGFRCVKEVSNVDEE